MLVAVMLTVCVADTVGAVNRPALVIAPWPADQLTPVSPAFVTVAANCCWSPEWMIAETGDSEILGVGDVNDFAAESPAHPQSTRQRGRRQRGMTVAIVIVR